MFISNQFWRRFRRDSQTTQGWLDWIKKRKYFNWRLFPSHQKQCQKDLELIKYSRMKDQKDRRLKQQIVPYIQCSRRNNSRVWHRQWRWIKINNLRPVYHNKQIKLKLILRRIKSAYFLRIQQIVLNPFMLNTVTNSIFFLKIAHKFKNQEQLNQARRVTLAVDL